MPARVKVLALKVNLGAPDARLIASALVAPGHSEAVACVTREQGNCLQKKIRTMALRYSVNSTAGGWRIVGWQPKGGDDTSTLVGQRQSPSSGSWSL